MARVLTVDDDLNTLRMLSAFLAPDGYEITEATEGRAALALVSEELPDVILLDLNLRDMSGFDVLQRLKGDEWTRLVPVVVVTADGDRERRLRAVEFGAEDFLTKPVDREELRIRVRTWLRLKQQVDQLERVEDVLRLLGRSVEVRDPRLHDHCERMARLTEYMGRALQVDSVDRHTLRLGAFLHDLGKIALPDTVLLKAGRLTEPEMAIVRTHPVLGDEILRPLRTLDAVRPLVRHHHEHLDGSGYPDGLAGPEIPHLVRIISVADVYDALTSPRSYRDAFDSARALQIIDAEVERGWWDPEIVATLRSVCGRAEAAPCRERVSS